MAIGPAGIDTDSPEKWVSLGWWLGFSISYGRVSFQEHWCIDDLSGYNFAKIGGRVEMISWNTAKDRCLPYGGVFPLTTNPTGLREARETRRMNPI